MRSGKHFRSVIYPTFGELAWAKRHGKPLNEMPEFLVEENASGKASTFCGQVRADPDCRQPAIRSIITLQRGQRNPEKEVKRLEAG